MIVFTIYENGGNAGAFGASFSCAVFGVRCGSDGNNGAQVFGRALGYAVLNDDAGAFVCSFGRSVSQSLGTD